MKPRHVLLGVLIALGSPAPAAAQSDAIVQGRVIAGADRSAYVFSAERRWPSGTIPSTAQRRARLLVLGFELADHSLSLVVRDGDASSRSSSA
jgi:hypothetical protein